MHDGGSSVQRSPLVDGRGLNISPLRLSCGEMGSPVRSSGGESDVLLHEVADDEFPACSSELGFDEHSVVSTRGGARADALDIELAMMTG